MDEHDEMIHRAIVQLNLDRAKGGHVGCSDVAKNRLKSCAAKPRHPSLRSLPACRSFGSSIVFVEVKRQDMTSPAIQE